MFSYLICVNGTGGQRTTAKTMHPSFACNITMLLVTLLSFSFSSHAHSDPNTAIDQHALLAFKAAMASDPYDSLFFWNPNILTFCQWTGVKCNLLSERVVELNLTNMGLQGHISPSLGNMSFLQSLDLSHNYLSGFIPQQLGRLLRLRKLILSSNELEGPIPSELGALNILQRLSLGGNGLKGQIPVSLANCSQLTELDLTYNSLSGLVPAELGALTNLQRLSLGGNGLKGHIPVSLANCSQLTELDLTDNSLSGLVPAELGALTNLQILSLGGNGLKGHIPVSLANCSQLTELDLTYNSLSGLVPAELGALTNLERLSLGANRLNGHIPDSLGNCLALLLLDLSQNAFQGWIPLSLCKLRRLGYIDLSFNNLSGTIPWPLEQMAFADFSFNNLTREIPSGGFSPCVSGANSMGNPCLRTSWTRSHLKRVIGLVVGICGFIPCCLLALCFRNHMLHCRSSNFAEFVELKLGYPKISYKGLFNATNGFNEANLLGVGNFGAVYEGILGDGTVVAIKVFNLQNEEAHMSFRKECKVLGRVRHRNLVKIITSYSSLDFKCLILQYMSRGNLENCLYADEGVDGNGLHASGLDLNRRLNIAIDIAEAMTYLHHHCFVQVVHCDLKPSNVLLDDTLTAHVTDFGIARLTCPRSTDPLSSTLALNGSIGYIAPEYGLGERISTKGDVYSYGIILLEMLTRRKPTDNMFSEGLNLRGWVNMAFRSKIMDVVDKSLVRDLNNDRLDPQPILNCLGQLIRLGLSCTNESPRDRPTMIDILAVLHNIKVTYRGIKEPPKLPLDISSLLDTPNVMRNNVAASQSHSSSTF